MQVLAVIRTFVRMDHSNFELMAASFEAKSRPDWEQILFMRVLMAKLEQAD